ncbi:MAG: nicotinate (nicotinamide) nucleotide adenylyltransferase [Elusimicrobiaceae bacterium]|nr:nicotinate (nicotinamide) nucleotide adenylyltransferase [Elusimicrobiaceae bacterium]
MYKPWLPVAGDGRRLKVGLLGGSFNPAHEGHRYISLEALKQLGLDEVWWLVSPLNPFKAGQKVPPLELRVAEAEKIAANPKIKVSGIENELGTYLTADTLEKLCKRFPNVDFVWLMGDDLAEEFTRWYRWRKIFSLVSIAVFSRKAYPWQTVAAKAFRAFAKSRVAGDNIRNLARTEKPAWAYVRMKPNPLSSTLIRNKEKEGKYICPSKRKKLPQ